MQRGTWRFKEGIKARISFVKKHGGLEAFRVGPRTVKDDGGLFEKNEVPMDGARRFSVKLERAL